MMVEGALLNPYPRIELTIVVYSIPKRRELVKEAAKNPTSAQLKETLQEQQEYLWTTDPVSSKPLHPPIVSGCTGTLYNKEAILEFLLPSADDDFKKAETEKLLDGTVRSLKDVVEVKFEPDPDNSSRWICPIINKPLGPGTKAVYLVPCGHAFSAAAIKEVSEEKCLQCNEPYASSDVIPILPISEVDVKQLEVRIASLKEKGLTHSLKKATGSKKRKKNGTEATAKSSDQSGIKETEKSSKENGTSVAAPTIKNSSTASLTAKVLEEQEKRNKKRKLQKNENLNSLFSSRDQKGSLANSSDYMSRGFTIPNKKKS
jgi:Rtf2 RING-finger